MTHRRRRAHSMLEYGILTGLLSLGLVGGVKVLGFAIGGGFEAVGGGVNVIAGEIESGSTASGAPQMQTTSSGAPLRAGRLQLRSCLRHDFVVNDKDQEVCQKCGEGA